eukprot:10402931-Alexandrium_andersonii.AAC.1
MSSDFAQGHRCCSELREGCRSTSAQGSTPRVALDLVGNSSLTTQIPEGSTSSDASGSASVR